MNSYSKQCDDGDYVTCTCSGVDDFEHLYFGFGDVEDKKKKNKVVEV